MMAYIMYLIVTLTIGLITLICAVYIYSKNHNRILRNYIFFLITSFLHILFFLIYVFEPEAGYNGPYKLLFVNGLAFVCDFISISFFVISPFLVHSILKRDGSQYRTFPFYLIFFLNLVVIIFSDLILAGNAVFELARIFLFVLSLTAWTVYMAFLIIIKMKDIKPPELQLFFRTIAFVIIMLYPAILLNDYLSINFFKPFFPHFYIFSPALAIIWNLLSIFYFIRHFLSFAQNFSPTEIPSGFSEVYDLTGREIEVLTLILNGVPYKEITVKLNISINTVKKHMTNIYRKLGVGNRLEALGKVKAHISGNVL